MGCTRVKSSVHNGRRTVARYICCASSTLKRVTRKTLSHGSLCASSKNMSGVIVDHCFCITTASMLNQPGTQIKCVDLLAQGTR